MNHNIGEPCKSLYIRIAQYKNNVRVAQENSSNFCHHHDYNHQISSRDASEILFILRFYTINLLEFIIFKITYGINMNLRYIYNAEIFLNILLKISFLLFPGQK